MSQYYNVVPWFNSEEWIEVYNKITANPPILAGLQEALNLLNIWKARCPSLPSGIESTLGLLDVHLKDLRQQSIDESDQEVLLRLAYSSAIMRFVNHMLDSETVKGVSLYRAAKNLEVPDWVIDLRHDAAHSNTLPSLELLREAAQISFQWLQNNYWIKYRENIKDYVVNDQMEGDKCQIVDVKTERLFNLYLALSICSNSQCKIKNLADITDSTMQSSIIKEIEDFFGNAVNLNNLNTISVMSLINMLNAHGKTVIHGGKDKSATINKVLLGEDSLFLSLELLDELSQTEFYHNNSLSKNYIQCFEVLLTFLHSNGLILQFILDLISITQENNCDVKCKLAALWVSEILKALKRSNQFLQIKTLSNKEISKKTKRKVFKQCFPSQNMSFCHLLLDLSKRAPVELTNINFIQPIIATYNQYLTYFMKDLLSLIEPKLPKATTEKICSLAEMISTPPKFPTNTNKVYTVHDLNFLDDQMSNADSDSDCIEVEDSKVNSDVSTEMDDLGIWEIATGSDWSTCPIGLLPWQINRVTLNNMEQY